MEIGISSKKDYLPIIKKRYHTTNDGNTARRFLWDVAITTYHTEANKIELDFVPILTFSTI